MSPVDELYALLRETLEAANAALASDAPGGGISRAYVSAGPPAWDCCPQLTVHAGGAIEGNTMPLGPQLQPGHRVAETSVVPLVILTITVLRCAPIPEQSGSKMKLPSAVDLENTAKETLGDVWAIWHGLRRAVQAGTLYASESCSREVFFDPASPVNTQGGCAGWQIPLRVALGIYP